MNQQNLPKADLINFIIIRVVSLAGDAGEATIVPNYDAANGTDRLIALPAASVGFLPHDGIFWLRFENSDLLV